MTIQVSIFASEPGDGTESRPYRTIQEAIAVAASGDTILVGDGIYDACIRLDKGGSREAPLILSAVHPGGVTINGSETGICLETINRDAGFLVLRGLRFQGGSVIIRNVDGWTLENCEISHSPSEGLLIGDPADPDHGSVVGGGFHRISRCDIHDCNGEGITADRAPYLTIEHCRIFRCDIGIGLDRELTGAQLRYNHLHDNHTADLFLMIPYERIGIHGNRFLSKCGVRFLTPLITFTDNECADGGPWPEAEVPDEESYDPEPKEAGETEPDPRPEPPEPEPSPVHANLVLAHCEACVFPSAGETFTVHEVYVRGNEVWMTSVEQPEETVYLDCEYGYSKKEPIADLKAPFTVDVTEDGNLLGIVNTLATFYRILTKNMVQDPQVVCAKIRDKANEALSAADITMRFTPQSLKFIMNKSFITLEEVIDMISAGEEEIVAEIVE